MKKIYTLFTLCLLFSSFSTLASFNLKENIKTINLKVEAKDGVAATISLKKNNYQVMHPIIMYLKVVNNSKNDIFLDENLLFDSIEISIIEKSLNIFQTITVFKVDGQIVKDPDNYPSEKVNKIKERKFLEENVTLTSYGKSLTRRESNKGNIIIQPGSKYSYKINLSRIFDFSVVAEYRIFCKLKYNYSNKTNEKQKQILSFPEMKIKLKY